MEQNGEVSKLQEMVMCGDHPSITKAALNAKEGRPLDKDKLKDRMQSYAKVTPTTSRTDRTPSEHAVRRRAISLEAVKGREPADRALLEALSSFRWPPYLVCVWVAVLLLTHLLYGLAAALDRAVPALRNLCQYFREWTEESWKKSEGEANNKVRPIALACAACALYAAYACACVARTLATWAVDPLRAGAALPLPHLPSPPLPRPSTEPTPPAPTVTCLPPRPNFPARDFTVTDYTDDIAADNH